MLRHILFSALFVLGTAATALADWPHDPATGRELAPSSFQPVHLPDDEGGMYVAYSLGTQIVAQRFDARGEARWGAGVVVCNPGAGARGTLAMEPHAWGGIVVMWNDNRSDPGRYDLYAQRLTPEGIPMWTADGVGASVGGAVTNNPVMTTDAYGGTCIAWEDQRDFALSGVDIYYQYLYPNGGLYGPESGMALAAGPGWQDGPSSIASGYSHFIAWCDRGAPGGGDVRLQRVEYGWSSWGPGGAVVCSSPDLQHRPSVTALGGDGIAVAWEDFAGGTSQVRMQLMNIYGSAVWAAAGVAVAAGSAAQSDPRVIADGEGGVVAVWRDARHGTFDLYAQRLIQSGTATWAAGGVAVRVGSGPVSGHRLARADVGEVLVAWQDTRQDAGDIHAQKLSPSGTALWRSGGVAVQRAPGSQLSPRVHGTSDGGAWVAWDDYRPSGFSARHQVVDRWGYLGAAPRMAGVGDVAGDQGGQVRVAWHASGLDTDPAFSVITDYFVFRSVPAPLAARLAREESALRGTDGTLTTSDGRRFRRLETAGSASYFWEEIGRVAPRRLPGYSFLAPTESDSTASGNPLTAFLVMAQGTGGGYWMTLPDSGYSVDNLAPAAPQAFAGTFASGTVQLSWAANREADLAGYRLHRGSDAGFVPGADNLVAALTDTVAADPGGALSYYKLVAVDHAGNRSPAALLSPGSVLDAPASPATRVALAPPTPRPWAPGQALTIRYSLPRPGPARLSLFDAAGRRVRVLADGHTTSGEHAVRVTDAALLQPGLYLLRLDAAGERHTQRVVVTR